MTYNRDIIKRIKRLASVCLCLLASLCVYLLASSTLYAAHQVKDGILSHITDTVACRQWVDSQLKQMTLKQRIGQLFIHTVEPSVLQRNKDQIQSAIKDYGIGGLLFSSGQAEKQVQITNLAQKWSRIPLMITFDGEWGLSMRLKDMPVFPKNRVLGCISNDSLIYKYGRETARELKEIGVQVNFAPVTDIDNNPENPVINVRSFGSNPQEVGRKVAAYVKGLQDGGVMAVCKHFPGHGDTNVDSHKALPTLKFNKERLDSIELPPFRKGIEAGVAGVMVGHLHVPELSDHPASVSQSIISNTLCQELQFGGLVFTDALEMKGIASHSESVCADALLAGNDVLLVPRNLKKAMASVMQAIKDKRISEKLIEDKCRKVLTYKYALGLNTTPIINETGIAERICTPEAALLSEELDRAAVTVLKDSAEMLPLNATLSGNVLLSISPSLSQAYPFYHQLKESIPVSWIHANPDSINWIRERLRPVQQVIVSIHQKDYSQYLPLINELAKDKPVAIVHFAIQAPLTKTESVLNNVSAIVLAHADTEPLQRYVADVITGKDKVDGRLSVDIGGRWKSGTGITIDPDHPYSYTPEDFGMSSKTLSQIDDIAKEGIQAKAYPGCHILILKEGYPIYNKCFGTFTYSSQREIKENDMFDLASVSKVAGTLLAVMKLYDEGRFGLTDKISKYITWLKNTDKKNITIEELLFHESGLPAYINFYEDAIDKKALRVDLIKKKRDAAHRIKIDENQFVPVIIPLKKEFVSSHQDAKYSIRLTDSLYLNPAFHQVMRQKVIQAPVKGHSYRYSCVNFMLLKEMVESLSGKSMDAYLDSVFYKPMGLTHTAYNPTKRFNKSDIVPTSARDYIRRITLQGEVNDEAAALWGGVSGNAGLFSTAHDLSTLFQMLLDKGMCGDRRYLSRATCELFLNMKSKNSRRGLGFDKPDTNRPDASPCAPEAPASVFGHTGFTGTAVWADPDNDLLYIFLSNRTYPTAFDHKNLLKNNIRPRIQQVMYRALNQ